MNSRPLILVTNDDGYAARGIHALIDMILPLGDVVMIAPDSPRSGQSSAITAHLPLRIEAMEERAGYRAYRTNGTPTDCIKLALHTLLEGRTPDLIVSGINHGSNAGISIIYSGTMGAALEGAIVGIPAVGFSLCDHASDAQFEGCTPYVTRVVKELLASGLPDGVCLNVNIPKGDNLRGMRLCRQARGHWTEEYVKRTDPMGKTYYWLTGHFENHEPNNEETDEWALANNYVSVVPAHCDMTATELLPSLQELLG